MRHFVIPRPLYAAVLGLLTALPAAAAPVCSNDTLRGTYLYEILGRDALPAGASTAGPYAEAGMSVYDGQGQVVTTYSSSRAVDATIAGTYQLDPDCVGTAVYQPPEGSPRRYRLYVDPQGTRLNFIDVTDTAAGYILGGEQRRAAASASPSLACSNRTLQGTYAYSIEGAIQTDQGLRLFREAGLEAFDGAGRIVNRYTDNLGTEAIITGHYTLQPNCTGTTTYDSGGVYQIYADPLGRRFVFVDLQTGDQRSGENVRIARELLVPGIDDIP